MDCPEALRAQAYFDAELDALGAVDFERHMARCASCRTQLEDLEQVRATVRRVGTESVPAELRSRVSRALDLEDSSRRSSRSGSNEGRGRWRPFWVGALGGAAASAAATLIVLGMLHPSSSETLVHDLLADQMRSLMPSHLIDVESTDQHTVKPWFAGHADVSPTVADFTAQGYRLIGGRADYIDHQRSAVVVYRHGQHVVNVFAWFPAGSALPSDTTRGGYRMSFWRVGDIDYCAVSDAGWDELRTLRLLLRSVKP